ncbi:MAG TPA: flagellar hook-associated protein FlgK [Opitutaceae bacterium]|jgi:flagellar hook-associated protein 1 FlgK
MAGLLSTLTSAASALNASTASINVTSNNIANANNPYYSQETATLEDRGSVETTDGPVSIGTQIQVTQARDSLLDGMVQQQASLTSGFSAQQSILQDAQASLGESLTDSSTNTNSTSTTTTESGLGSALNSFFNAFQSLSANPGNSAQVQSLLQQAGVLSDRFQEIDGALSQVQADATNQVTGDVSAANQLISQIAQLNSQIAAVNAQGVGSADQLIDQREGAIEQLAAYIPISVSTAGNSEDTITTTDSGGNPIQLLTNGTVTNSLSFTGGSLEAGSTALGVSSGSIQGTIDASTGPVQTLRDNLDSLAKQLVLSVNAAYNPNNTAGGNFFDANGQTAGTIAVDSNLTAANLTSGSGAAGDNSIAVAVANLANQTYSTGSGDDITGTFTNYYAGAVTTVGQALDSANTQVSDQTSVQTLITNQRQSVSGVSIDEEMSNLMTYQSAYQASSELLSVVSGLLSTLITSVSGA